jgi:hypothetical protein
LRLQFSPYQLLCLVAEFPPREVCEDGLPLALAAHLDSVFRTDHHHIVTSRGASGKAMGIVAAIGEILKRGVEGQ